MVSVAFPEQSCPPFDAAVATSLVRVFSPPPHDTEQDDQSPYDPHRQLTGQPPVLQATDSVASPSQSCPPFDAGVSTSLVRDFSPPPHDTVQDDQSL